MSTTTPLLAGNQPNYSAMRDSSFETRFSEERRKINQLRAEEGHLKRMACMRKTATKITACVCLPFSIFFHCCETFWDRQCDHKAGRYIDEEGAPFFECTTCDGGRCWRPALPPRDCESMCSLACDPCVCCICCAQDKIEHYLFPPERQRMETLKVTLLVNDTLARTRPHPVFFEPTIIQRIMELRGEPEEEKNYRFQPLPPRLTAPSGFIYVPH